MKRVLTMMFVVLFSHVAVCAAEIAEWPAQAETLLSSMGDMSEQFSADMNLYESLLGEIEQLNHKFDDEGHTRQSLWTAVSSFLMNFGKDVGPSYAQLASAVLEKDSEIKELRQQLASLSHDTHAEIESLKNTIAELNQDLNAAHQAYAALVNSDNELAQELIEKLSDLKLKYNQMIDQRRLFLAALERLMNNMDHSSADEEVLVETDMAISDSSVAVHSEDLVSQEVSAE